jgi:hypothetical protein
MHILDQEAPGLAERLRALEPANQRAVLVRVALFTAARLSGPGTGTSLLLEALRSHGELSAAETKSAMSLSELADEKYFQLQEKGRAECEKSFFEARLLRGMAVGFGASAQGDIADAVYELAKATDDSAETIKFIESGLNSTIYP